MVEDAAIDEDPFIGVEVVAEATKVTIVQKTTQKSHMLTRKLNFTCMEQERTNSHVLIAKFWKRYA